MEKTYNVKFNVDGKAGREIQVSARDCSQAKRIAQAKLESTAGYANKKIHITGAPKAR